MHEGTRAMSDRVTNNRTMFWRIVRRLITAHRGRLFVILLALSAGAAVTAALLNLQVDAKRRLTTEFRAFGPNVIIAPRKFIDSTPAKGSATLPESLLQQLPHQSGDRLVPAAAFLYTTADFTAYSDEGIHNVLLGSGHAVFAGYRSVGDELGQILPHKTVEGDNMVILDAEICEIGEKLASRFGIHAGGVLQFKIGEKKGECLVSKIQSFGASEDSQIFPELETLQQLADLPRQVSLFQLNVPGTPKEIDNYVAGLRRQFPNLDVRPIRQFTEAQSKIYNRISGLLNFTVALVLILTGLCVMAAMTNVAMERRNDVGLMKAIGGAKRRVLRLFIAEATLLGLAGGIIGAAAGIALSIFLGKAVFGLAARPRLIVYPISVVLTLIVAILSAFPLRRLASIRPASVFRGEA
jgi:putative ABC transport system permease protein